MEKLKKQITTILKLVRLDEVEILPAHLAFYLIMMIVPICSLIGLLGSTLNVNDIYETLNNSVPDAVLSLINGVTTNSNNYNLFIFIIFSLWLSSNGTKAIIISSNLLFQIKDKNNIKIRIKALLMVLVLFFLIVFIIFVPVLGDLIINFLTKYLMQTSIMIITKMYNILKYPLSLFFMFVLIKVLYTMAPSKVIESKYMNSGALFTTLTWFSLSRIYSYNLNNYSNYNVYYGSLSNILILLVWVYLLAYIFVIGLSINANNYLAIKNQRNN